MSDREQTATPAGADGDAAAARVFSGYGIASAVLGVVAVAAVVLGALIWSSHRGSADERAYQTRVLQAAADWTGVLINMNVDNVDASLARLRDGTAGELNADFESSIEPYREVVKKLRSRTTGQLDSVSLEAVHREPGGAPGRRADAPAALPAELARRTDTVLVVATSVSANAGAKPTTVRWNLRLEVSDVAGRLLVSRLESLR